MIIYDLKCSTDHVFEAWFGSASDYENQRERGLVACPLCNDLKIERIPSRVAIGGAVSTSDAAVPVRHDHKNAAPASSNAPAFDVEKAKSALAAMAKVQAEAVAKSDYVGTKFAQEARAMHYGEQTARPIYGETDRKEAKALYEEGVPAMPLLFPVKNKSDA